MENGITAIVRKNIKRTIVVPQAGSVMLAGKSLSDGEKIEVILPAGLTVQSKGRTFGSNERMGLASVGVYEIAKVQIIQSETIDNFVAVYTGWFFVMPDDTARKSLHQTIAP